MEPQEDTEMMVMDSAVKGDISELVTIGSIHQNRNFTPHSSHNHHQSFSIKSFEAIEPMAPAQKPG